MKLLIAGDFVPQHRITTQIEQKDYSCLNEVKQIIQSVDYAIVNFESPVVVRNALPIQKTGPHLRCSEKAMDCIANNGFNCVTLANNHFRDYGQIGVEDTIDSCIKYNIDYVGGGKDIFEANKILYKNINEEKLAIINICENEWSIASESRGGSNPLNPIKNYYVIKEARENADYVLIIVHGGMEGYQFPTPRMQETYRFFIDVGADAVINHHQHCYSGYEVYQNKPIFYGLGNFCFERNDRRGNLWNKGYLVKLQLVTNEISFEILPYMQCDEISAVVMMDKENFKTCIGHIAEINKIISNSELLMNQFKDKISSIYESRLLALEPITNKFIRKLQMKHIFPRLMHKKQRKSMYMRIQCESNRETLIEVLKKYFSNI